MGIPSLIKCFFVVECVIFGPFALHHYLACAHTKQLEHLSSNRVAWLVLHSGEMLHGVGALLVLFVVLNALIINEVSTIELEIILLAHSLWLSTIIGHSLRRPRLRACARKCVCCEGRPTISATSQTRDVASGT